MSYVVDTQFRNLCDMAKAVHKGELVRKRITQSGVSVKSIAARLGVSRQTLYDYLERDDLNFDIINRIGFAIKYDFSQDIPEILGFKNNMLSEPDESYGKDINGCLEELIRTNLKYFRLMDDYIALLREARALGYKG